MSPVRPTDGMLFYCADLSHYPDTLTFSGAGRSVNEKALELLRPAIATRASGFRRAPPRPDGTLARTFGRRHRIATSPGRDSSEPWELKVWCGEWSACQPNGASVSEDACWRVRSGSVVSAVNEGDGFRKERPQAVVWRRDESSKLVSHAPPPGKGPVCADWALRFALGRQKLDARLVEPRKPCAISRFRRNTATWGDEQ